MKIGDVFYLKERSDGDGIISEGSDFWRWQYPELAELYEFQYDLPDYMKRMCVPPISEKNGLVAHVIASQRGVSRFSSPKKESITSKNVMHAVRF